MSENSSNPPTEGQRKKRNRWGSPPAGSGSSSTIGEAESKRDTDGSADGTKRVRKSRWATESEAVVPQFSDQSNVNPLPSLNIAAQGGAGITSALPSVVNALDPAIVQHNMILKLQLQEVNQKLLTVEQDAKRIEQDPNRSPSPPPKYDAQGKRTNRRDVRMREALNKERVRLLEEMMRLNPTFRPAADLLRGKPVNKIFIPKASDPDYNYIGLIIGPRGNTQKQMEQETKCKISIRGKGSAKEGSKGRANKNIDDDEELHVHIQGDDQESVDKASKMIEALLNPDDSALNDHKQKQLRELALINGTLREDEYCPVCGEKGHRQFECPHRAKTFKAAGVKCAICGDLSHPTRDCPLKQEDVAAQGNLDSEYDNFLAELNGAPGKAEKSSQSSDAHNVQDHCNTDDTKAENSSDTKGPTYLAPIVDVLGTVKKVDTVPSASHQTIMNVNGMMPGSNIAATDGSSIPASYLASNGYAADPYAYASYAAFQSGAMYGNPLGYYGATDGYDSTYASAPLPPVPQAPPPPPPPSAVPPPPPPP